MSDCVIGRARALALVVVVLLLDVFFIAQWREGLSFGFDLNDRIASDWPVFLAHIILFTCLLAMSAIDLEHYWIDTRFTHFATIAGLVLFTIWTPHDSEDWIRPYDTTAIVCLAVFATFVVTLEVNDCLSSATAFRVVQVVCSGTP